MDVFYSVPMNRAVQEPAANALLRIAHNAGRMRFNHIKGSYTRVDIARNNIIQAFREVTSDPDDTLIMLDDDHEHPPNILEQLALAPKDFGVIAARAHVRGDDYRPMIYFRTEEGPYGHPTNLPPDGAYIPSDYAGPSAMAIRRWVFDKLDAEIENLNGRYFKAHYSKELQRELSEDWWFAYICEQAGITHHVDSGLEIPHLRFREIGPDDWYQYVAWAEATGNVPHKEARIITPEPPRPDGKPKIFYSFLMERFIGYEALQSMMTVAQNNGRQGYTLMQTPYAATVVARNRITEDFLQATGCPHSIHVMLDADHKHPGKVVEQLVSHPVEVGVVGALAFARTDIHQPVFYTREERGLTPPVEGLDRDELLQGVFVGSGAIAIRRWVYERLYMEHKDMPPFWRIEFGPHNPGLRGEDWTFAKYCEMASIPHYCDTSVMTPHLTWETIGWENYAEWVRKNKDNLEETGYEMTEMER